MTKIKFILLLFFALVLLPVVALAQSNLISGSGALLGSEHQYSVTVKASGTLVVDARIVVSNFSDENKSDYYFEKPEGLNSKVIAFQQILGKTCSKVDYGTINNNYTQKCLEYRDPNYGSYYNYYYDDLSQPNTYKVINVEESNGKLKFHLSSAIEPYQNGAIILSYYLMDRAKSEVFGRKIFTFNSLGDEDVIKQVDVAVDTDSDLFVKEKRSSVTSVSAPTALEAVSSSGSINSTALDNFSNDVGRYGGWIEKSGKDILPGENFTVSGIYSTSWFGLYWKYLLVILIIIIAVILAAVWLIQKAKNHIQNMSSPSGNVDATSMGDSKRTLREALNARNIGVSFAIAAGSILIVIGLEYLVNYLFYSVNYDYSLLIELADLAIIFILVIIALGYPIYQVVKKGINAALVVVCCYIITIIIGVFIGAIIVAATNHSSPPTYPVSDYNYGSTQEM